jgi:hypothetical protein
MLKKGTPAVKCGLELKASAEVTWVEKILRVVRDWSSWGGIA